MMNTSEWQLFISGLSQDEWMQRLLGAKNYALWVATGRPEYPRFCELRGKEKAKPCESRAFRACPEAEFNFPANCPTRS